MKGTLLACGVGTGLLLAGLPIAYLTWPAPKPPAAAEVRIGGPYQLIDAAGRQVDEKTFSDVWTLVFFGFTRCPDVCPTTLASVAKVLNSLGSKAERLQPLFITLDPEQDTVDVIGEYATFFDPRIIGLTGSPEQVRQAADAYAVYYRKVPAGDTYLLDHTVSLYLMAPGGVLAEVLSLAEGPAALTRRIEAALDAN